MVSFDADRRSISGSHAPVRLCRIRKRCDRGSLYILLEKVSFMSILNVERLSHGFGDRAIFNDVSFRLLKGEHIGLIGANGEGKSTFMNIITGKLQPDDGKVEWSKRMRVGYLDQHAVLNKGMTIRDVLKGSLSISVRHGTRNERYVRQDGRRNARRA